MQGLPTQLLSKSSKTEVFGEKKAAVKTDVGVNVESNSEVGSNKENDGFASLFNRLAGKENSKENSNEKSNEKPSDVKSETGDILKNLLAAKNSEITKVEGAVVSADQVLIIKNNPKTSEGQVEQKIANTSNNLDQLLNNLKGIQNPEASESDDTDQVQEAPKKNQHQIKGELKSASPLDFLMNGAKTTTLKESAEPTAPPTNDIGSVLGQKKVMTGEDYIKNMVTSEKKDSGKLALLNGQVDFQKMNTQNVKGYGQGLSLLSDPLIKNTKDLATKDGKKGNLASVDELRSPDTKVTAELSIIKQDAIPGMQNNKNSHGQQAETQTQTNQKVLDLGKINTANTTEIIKRISDYVEQNQVANKSSLDLTVKHESLGEFKIQVSKMPSHAINQGSSLIDMQITTSSKEGHDFFVKNEVSLMKNLNQAGINLSDFRIISTMSEATPFGQSDSKNSSSFSQNADGTDKQFMSFESNNFSSDTSSGSERRKELWEEYQQRYGA